MLEKNSVGKAIGSYCGKCRVNRDHTIMTMDGETIAKVRCQMCGRMHKFMNPLDVPKIRKPRAKKDAGEIAKTAWVAGLAEAKGKERDYSMASKYHVGDIVNHQPSARAS